MLCLYRSGGSSTMSTSGRATGRVFDDKKSENSWFDGSDASSDFGLSDEFGPSSSSSSQSSSAGWDPRTSLGAAQPQTGTEYRRSSPASRGGFDRAQPDFGRSSSSTGRFDRGSASRGDMTDRRSSGSSWERGESRPSRGGSQSRGRQGGFADRGRGSSTRGSSTRGRSFGNTGRRSESTARDLPGGSNTEKPWESRPAPQNREDNFDF